MPDWIRIPLNGKSPITRDWPNADGLTDEQAQRRLEAGQNIGVLCGERSGRLLVLDYDDGEPPNMPITPRVLTGGGGVHDYYHVPDGIDLGKANRVKFWCRGVKIDARWTGGQVVYPGSVHPETGAIYEWAPGRSPDDVPLADVPDDVIRDICRRDDDMTPFLRAALDGACNDIRTAPIGQRNDILNARAYHLGGYPYPDHGVVARALLAAALDAGLPEAEARATIKSGITSGQSAPRDVPDRPSVTIKPTQPPAFYFKALGYYAGKFYFLPRDGGQIVDYSAIQLGALSNLLTLAPLQYWETTYPGEKSGVKTAWAADALIALCHAEGLFNPRDIRGRGAWHDDGRIVVHRGSSLLVDGVESSLIAIKSRYYYQLEHDLEIPYDAPLSAEDATRGILAICNNLVWERTQYGNLLAGWLALAPICGVLDWRPHIWITGTRGTGKSYIQDHIVPMLGRTCVRVQGCSTEAGIRQLLQSDVLSVAFDEAENDTEKAAANIGRVLELARQASSSDGGVIAKGSANGHAQTYDIRSMFAVSSITVGIQRAADASRVTVMQLSKPPVGPEGVAHFRELQADTATWCKGSRARAFVARSVRMANTIRQNATIFIDALTANRATKRNADQIGTLWAGWWSLTSDEPVTEYDARMMACEYDLDAVLPDESVSDEQQFLDYLMALSIRCEIRGATVFRAIREIVNGSIDGEAGMDDALQRVGLRCLGDNGGLFISSSHTELARLLRGTQWHTDWNRFARRLDGVTQETICRIHRRPTRGVTVPYALIT